MSEAKRYEKSCGAVVFRAEEGEIKYLLVRGHEGFWGFPKGHVEPGESERETALREIREETGLNVALVDGFRTTDAHTLAREGKPNTIKQNVYFLAKYARQTPVRQAREIAEIALMDYAAALAAFRLASYRRILTEANDFLKQRSETTEGSPEADRHF